MLLKVKVLHLLAGRPIALINETTAKHLNLNVGERIRIIPYNTRKKAVAPIDIVGGTTILKEDEIALSLEVVKEIGLKDKDIVEIAPALRPVSLDYIKKKVDGKKLTSIEIYSIISDIVNNELTEAEVAYFVAGMYLRGMDIEEIVNLTKAMVKTGRKLKLDNRIIVDKHGIGGIPGYRITPIVTSIIAATIDKLNLNMAMPKTSSKAITSAAGTADVIETIAKVDFSIDKIKEIVNKTKACLVWGGSLKLAPADDKIIQIEKILSLDPEAQLIASILSKKLSVGASYVLIDIPYGPTAKVKDKKEALNLKYAFETVASQLGLKLRCFLSDGSQPVGRGIGPKLELKEVIKVLRRDDDRPKDLESRAVSIATELFSFATNMPKGKVRSLMLELLDSGAALKKFEEIINAQGGSLENIDEKLLPGKFHVDLCADAEGIVKEINNKQLAYICRIVGAPADKGAGIYLHVHLNNHVKKNQKLFTIYAETKEKLDYAKMLAKRIKPIKIG